MMNDMKERIIKTNPSKHKHTHTSKKKKKDNLVPIYKQTKKGSMYIEMLKGYFPNYFFFSSELT